MIEGASATRWTRIIRRLVRDAVSWGDAVAKCMGTADPGLRTRLTGEALGLAACMIGERLGREGVDRAHVKSVAAELQQAWASLLIRRGQSPATHPTPPLLGEAHEAIDRPASMPLPGPGSHGNAADPQQAAREFQQTTGLGAEALVNDGHNLPALVFYHRVYLAARSDPAFAPAHRAQIVKAAQQCRERFARELQRASNTKPPDRRRLAPMAERLARATRSGA